MKKILFVRKDRTTKEILSEIYIRKDEIKKDYISKEEIRNLILKYRCFGWHDKDDEYWANRILDGFEQCLEEE